jgi:hypothetical protein
MKVIKKNVYYCEFCKKKGLSGGHVSKHEKRCTNNPNRECGLCSAKNNISEIVDQFKKRFGVVVEKYNYEGLFSEEIETVKWIGEPITLQEIRDSVNDCPNCVFAVIRQCKFHYHYFGELISGFDYKKEREESFSSLMQSYSIDQ